MQALDDKTDVGAVIVAAGRGARMGGAGPAKQYRDLGNMPVLVRTVLAFHRVPSVREIVLVLPEADVAKIAADWRERFQGPKPVITVAGGPTRQASVWNGLQALSAACTLVVVHDGVRPLVQPSLVERVVAAARRAGAAVPAVPLNDTIKRVDGEGIILETLDRDNLRAVQTPQAFRRDVLERAHQAAMERPRETATDDAALVERLGHRVVTVPGDPRNVKLTRPEDFEQAEVFLMSSGSAASPQGLSPGFPPFRVGYGFDVHRLVPGRSLVLGGVNIPHEVGLEGHSDADVLAHAITDAVLGGAAAGDIGRQFPDTDEAYRGADSLKLLAEAVARVGAGGWFPAQVDATIIAQRPKLAPYIDAMRQRLATALGIPAGQVSVKATTSERLGFTGREEGIAVHAVALLVWKGGHGRDGGMS